MGLLELVWIGLDTWILGHLDTWTGNWTIGHLDGELDTWTGNWTLGHFDGELDTWTGNWTLRRGIGHFDGTEIVAFSMKGKCKNEAEVTSFRFFQFYSKNS